MRNGQTICLNMIVKNEEPVIRRCLESVRPLIDYWVIVDTGSTDGTMALIRECLQDIPGELHEHPWVDFATNRNQALSYVLRTAEHAPRCDYTFLLDADHIVGIEDGFRVPRLDADSYNIQLRYGSIVYLSKRLVRNDLPWRYVGVLHEYITCESARTEGTLPGVWQIPIHDGARARDPLTYRRDALVLERALLDEPDNARYEFYLAQSYRDAGDSELAIRHYRRRIELGGWAEEVFYALYQIARLMEQMGRAWEEVQQAYLAAYQFHADRIEPLYQIGMHYQHRREFHLAHLFLGRAMQLSFPEGNRLFVEKQLYDYLVALEYAVTSYWLGNHAEAIAINDRLLAGGLLPKHLVDRVAQNRRYSVDAVGSATSRPDRS